MVLKFNSGSSKRATMGLAREAFFFKELAPTLAAASVPRAFAAYGDMASGDVATLLECLEDAVPSGTFFGAAQPNNWQVKEQLASLCEGNPGPEEITTDAFSLYARLHGTYWQDDTLLRRPWLRASDWYAGRGEASWTGAQALAQTAWSEGRAAVDAGSSPIAWDAHVVACLDAAMARVSWSAYQQELRARPYSLVHGDAHAHNAMWVAQRTPRARQCLIDFEMVGVGSGAQELGQYVVSHVAPALRRARERAWVAGYHAELVATLRARGRHAEAEGYTLDACFAEYVAGGAGRWLWFMPLFLGMPAMLQFFHDQLGAFLHDHVPDPALAPMPRV